MLGGPGKGVLSTDSVDLPHTKLSFDVLCTSFLKVCKETYHYGKSVILTDSVDLPQTMLNFDGDILTDALKGKRVADVNFILQYILCSSPLESN